MALQRELEAGRGELDGLRYDNSDVNLRRFYYYSPLMGLTGIPGLVRLLAAHERRHHKQIREILEEKIFPRAVLTEE